jgi:hypothetical protein
MILDKVAISARFVVGSGAWVILPSAFYQVLVDIIGCSLNSRLLIIAPQDPYSWGSNLLAGSTIIQEHAVVAKPEISGGRFILSAGHLDCAGIIKGDVEIGGTLKIDQSR